LTTDKFNDKPLVVRRKSQNTKYMKGFALFKLIKSYPLSTFVDQGLNRQMT